MIGSRARRAGHQPCLLLSAAGVFATAVGIAVLVPGPLRAETVRIFAVGNKQRVADAVSYQTFRDKMFALVDRGYPGRPDLVQAEVDDVASHLRPSDPGAPALALVNFPEDVGLVAGLIGSRGATARTRTSSALAIGDLSAAYAPQIAHYNARFGPTQVVRDVFLGGTDTIYRAFYETFRDIAVTYGVHVTASVNVAPARRVEAAKEPALVALLRDPEEPERTYAYEATSAEVRNCVFIFAPDGEVIVPERDGSTRRSPSETGGVILPSITKAYLTPLELDLIGLVGTAVRDMDVVDTPVGRIGVVISKDAWMTDVNDRFEAKNAQVLLQSEAFSDWAFVTAEWSPDVFEEGGFSFLQKNPSFVVNIDPSMTGNLFDLTFDGQTTILGKKTKRDPGPLSRANAWIGQNPDTGFLALGPWVIGDPGIDDPLLTLVERRERLVEVGVALLPDALVPCSTDLEVGACANGYREAVVHSDVELPDGVDVLVARDSGPRVATEFGPNLRVNGLDGPTRSLQKNPRIAARRQRVVVVWQDGRHGLPSIYLAASSDAGASFSRALKVSDNAPGAVAEILPDVALSRGRLRVVWQEFVDGMDDDRGRIELAHFTLAGRKLGADVRPDGGNDASGKWRPAVAAWGRQVYVAWIDERDVSPDGIPFEHVYLAVSGDGGRSFAAPVRIDAGPPVALSTTLDNKWAPAIAARGDHVLVAWADFRNYNWDIFAAASNDRGASFAANRRVDDFAAEIERLHQNPAVAIVPASGRILAAWTDVRAREPDTNVFFATSDDDGASFSANAQLDGSRSGFDPNTDTPSNQWSPRLDSWREDVCVVWQDNRLGNNDVFFKASRDAATTFGADERVDDTGNGASEQYNPDLALTRFDGASVCYVVWEDTRDGDSDIYFAKRGL